jgi:pimeloyl-ACP methyl ester carboxylesterase
MTQHLTVDGGTLAYEVTGGSGPLVVLAHGLGDSRQAYRFVAPELATAGYRVATVDLRGCGESSAHWSSYTQEAIADDLLALVRHLGGQATLVGHSFAGGAATIAAAKRPSAVTALIEVGPFTRKQRFSLGDLRVAEYRRGAMLLGRAGMFGSVAAWKKYLELAYPGPRPADWAERMGQIDAMLREPGRMKALRSMVGAGAAAAGGQLANVGCPVLIVQGELDSDWVSPQDEGKAIVAALPAGLGRLVMVPGAGHYPHVQFPAQVVSEMLSFLASARA